MAEPETPQTPSAAEQLRESMDGIADPGQRAVDHEAPVTGPSKVDPAGSASDPETGGISTQLVERAIRAGLTSEEAKSTPQSFLERYLDDQERYVEPEPPPQPRNDFKFDPYTGKPLAAEPPKLELP